MSNIKKFLIIAIFIIGIICRFYKFNNPIDGKYSHRQADTASVTNNFLKNGIDLLHPTYLDLSNVQSGKENPHGYRMVELPIYNLYSLIVRQLTPFLNQESSYRLGSIILSLISAHLVYLVAFKLTSNFPAAFFSLAFYLLLPFNIYYSRTIIPEPMAVLFMLSSFYFLLNFKFLPSAIFFALGLLIKPYIALILFPVFLLFCLIHKTYFINLPAVAGHKSFFIFFILSLLPFFLWRQWIQHYPEGIPASDWLFNNSDKSIVQDWWKGYNINFINKMVAFRPYWFRWLFYERIFKLFLGSFAIIPFFLGFAYRQKHLQKFLLSFMAGIVLYYIIVAQGNIQHEYYQFLIIPFIAIIVGVGFAYIFNFLFHSKIISIISIFTIFLLSFMSGAKLLTGYYDFDSRFLLAGDHVDKNLPKDAIIIAPNVGNTTFLYYTRRSGYPTEIYNLDTLKQLIPDHPFYLVSVNNDQYTNTMAGKYSTIFKSSDFTILDLNHAKL